MKILLSWLREFVDVPGTAEQIATTMSVRGFAVEGIDSLPEYTEAVSADGTVARTPAASADAVIHADKSLVDAVLQPCVGDSK